MSRSSVAGLLVLCCLMAAVSTGCSRDPNVRKQKYFDSGEKFYTEGKYREAAIQYSNAVQIDPRYASAHYKLSQTYLKLNDKQRAFQELSRTIELAPDKYDARTDLANLLVTLRRNDGSADPDALAQAKLNLDVLKEKLPNSPETHEAWANYYAAQDNLPASMQEVQQAISLDPSRSESYLLLALLQLRANLPDQAEANFKKAVAADPKAMNAQLGLGAFYQSRNRLSDAEVQFKHAIDVDPKDTGARAALVRLLMQEGRRDQIETLLRQTKKDMPDNPEAYRMLGDYYFQVGDLDKAASEYGSLLNDHPKDLLTKKNYVQILILKNRLDEATKLNSEILKSNPRDNDTLIFKGQIQMRQNDPSGAIESLQSAVRNDSNNAVAHYQLGLAYAQKSDLNRAESEWREAIRIRPNLVDALRALAQIEISRGEPGALLQTAQQMITAEPYSPDGFIRKSIAELLTNKYTDAQHDAEEAMNRAPQSPLPYVQLGNIQLKQKHFADAEKFYRQSLDKDPSSADGLGGLMNTYIAQKQFDKAVAAAREQIAKSPNNSNFYDLLGTALFNGKKDYSGAEAALRKAVELDKNNIDALEKLGKVQIQQGSTDQAIAVYQQSMKDNPREVRFYILSGELYEAKHDYDKAKALYQQALNIYPEHPLASNNLAYLMLEQGGNIDMAMTLAQTARRGMPNSPNAADTLGWAYYHKGIYDSAISQFQEALRLNERNGAPDDSLLHYHLGLSYQKANRPSLARQQFEKAIQLSPQNADARKALAELRG